MREGMVVKAHNDRERLLATIADLTRARDAAVARASEWKRAADEMLEALKQIAAAGTWTPSIGEREQVTWEGDPELNRQARIAAAAIAKADGRVSRSS